MLLLPAAESVAMPVAGVGTSQLAADEAVQVMLCMHAPLAAIVSGCVGTATPPTRLVKVKVVGPVVTVHAAWITKLTGMT